MLLVMMRVVNIVSVLQVLMMPRLLLVRAIGVVAAILGAV